MTEQTDGLFELSDLEGLSSLTSITGLDSGVSAIDGDIPIRVSLLDLGFHDM